MRACAWACTCVYVRVHACTHASASSASRGSSFSVRGDWDRGHVSGPAWLPAGGVSLEGTHRGFDPVPGPCQSGSCSPSGFVTESASSRTNADHLACRPRPNLLFHQGRTTFDSFLSFVCDAFQRDPRVGFVPTFLVLVCPPTTHHEFRVTRKAPFSPVARGGVWSWALKATKVRAADAVSQQRAQQCLTEIMSSSTESDKSLPSLEKKKKERKRQK